MDFTLGILVGIVLCIAYGQYASNQAKKHQREQQKAMMDYFFKPRTDLQSALEDAIAREDFKEAARLRDLMNKP